MEDDLETIEKNHYKGIGTGSDVEWLIDRVKLQKAMINELLGCMAVIAKGRHSGVPDQLASYCIEKVHNITTGSKPEGK
jgi:hypothetical protein